MQPAGHTQFYTTLTDATSEYRSLQNQVAELQRLLGKKTMEAEILREAVSRAAGPKKLLLRSISLPGDDR